MRLVDADILDLPATVQAGTVTILRNMLERAERGEIQEVVLIGLETGGRYDMQSSGSLDVMRKVGMLEAAKHQELRHWLGND